MYRLLSKFSLCSHTTRGAEQQCAAHNTQYTIIRGGACACLATHLHYRYSATLVFVYVYRYRFNIHTANIYVDSYCNTITYLSMIIITIIIILHYRKVMVVILYIYFFLSTIYYIIQVSRFKF